MSSNSSQCLLKTLFFFTLIFQLVNSRSIKSTIYSTKLDESLTYIWPLPSQFTSGNDTLTVNPNLTLEFTGNAGSRSVVVVEEVFERYKKIIFKHGANKLSKAGDYFDINRVTVIVHSDNDELQLGVDESYSLLVTKSNERSIIGGVSIENVLHWHIIDEESFPLEVPSYPNLWKGSYTKWERYTVEDAIEIVE
ncbi:hypothetical protein RND71_025885 [Anisodus tanguticus]|uniref:beta-N-acetylhexosaminidase n=1 Tax=Anisodus tanguticus TaxID=243964 RepID=A0AAE1RMF5_9SOLA|nr:hypothetical protein RND71_025885 [Anisodus tanguticus]